MERVKSEVIVLCEDHAQATFARRFLYLRGYRSNRQVRILPLPGRKGGAGEKYVRDHYPPQLKSLRKWQNKALIVMIDADTGSVQRRKEQLDRACVDYGIERRNADEAAIVAIPKRNVETWFVYLTGAAWNEESDEWKRKGDDLATPAADALHEMCFRQQRLTPPAPPSLEDACDEWKRLR